MDPWHIPVDRAKALTLISPLPDGKVAGTKQVARRGGLIVTAELTETMRYDTWNGVRVQIVSPHTGELGSSWFGFDEYNVLNPRFLHGMGARGNLLRSNQADLLKPGRIRAQALRAAVASYTAVFAPLPEPSVAARDAVADRLGALGQLQEALDHLSARFSEFGHPDAGARFHSHAEVLREIGQEITADLQQFAPPGTAGARRSAAASARTSTAGRLHEVAPGYYAPPRTAGRTL
ncbi:hypothetical protein [Streptomyces sp. CBMA123]|uniref:hypothetical protein n=1 Tax=Streptomyces sp. CBMA123 TaxID=1896313 RepID=UPI001661F844|nr:hypothetical protein [Streptomyces sp. CBMA123]MBD0688300.1 hypothetical protein [Streptomyces sp. CBMA123]